VQATKAIIERAGNVQREIDHRMNVNFVDQSGRSGGLGRVDRRNEVHDEGLLPMPPLNGEIDANVSRRLEEEQRKENVNLEKGSTYGESGDITVSTRNHSDAPLPYFNAHLRRHQSHAQIDQVILPSQQQEQSSARPLWDNFFGQLERMVLCSHLDGLGATFATSTTDDRSSHVTGILFSANNDVLALTEMESETLCETLTGTMSGLTDEQRLTNWLKTSALNTTTQLPRIQENHTKRNNANQTPNQASNQPTQNVPISPDLFGLGRSYRLIEAHNNRNLSHLTNQATYQRKGEQNASNTNHLMTPRSLNQGDRSLFNHNSLTASQSKIRAKRVTSKAGALNQAKNQRNGVRNANTSILSTASQSLNQGQQHSIIHGPSTTSQSMNHANRVMSQVKAGGEDQVRSGGQGKVPAAHQGQARAVSKENISNSMKHPSNPPVKSPVIASLTKLKNGLFTKIGKKFAIEESDGGRKLKAKNKNNSTPSISNPEGIRLYFKH
jgi:hypothetical protein